GPCALRWRNRLGWPARRNRRDRLHAATMPGAGRALGPRRGAARAPRAARLARRRRSPVLGDRNAAELWHRRPRRAGDPVAFRRAAAARATGAAVAAPTETALARRGDQR